MSIDSAANAFGAQSNLFAWMTGVPAVKSRMAFLDAYGSTRLQQGPLQQQDVDIAMTHMRSELHLLREGTPVFVTSEVMDLVDEAVEEMPSEVLLHQDLLMDECVLWFERPLRYHPNTVGLDGELHEEPWLLDAVGVQFKEHAILVHESADPVGLPAYTNALDYSDDELRNGVVLYCYVAHKNIPPSIGPIEYRSFGPYGLIDFLGCGFDVDWSTRDLDNSSRELHKWLIALLRLMGEHIEMRPRSVGRALRRAAARVGREVPQDGYLNIIHLRSIVYGGEMGETEETRKLRWKHRVRGHWQRFYCASRQLPVGDPGAYRHRYVNSYVRGPGDVPVERHDVVVVDR